MSSSLASAVHAPPLEARIHHTRPNPQLPTPTDEHTDTLPPSYASLPRAPHSSQYMSSPRAATIDSHAEKQALRDAQRRMDSEVERNRGHLSPTRLPPESIDPRESASLHDGQDNRPPNGTGNSNSHSGSNSTGSRGGGSSIRGPATAGGSPHPRTSTNSRRESQDQQSVAGGASTTGRLSTDNLQVGHRGLLPSGLDVQDALAKCEDPTLGWSLHFWVTLADPLTQHVFFANPASGQCSWDPPVGAFVVPRSPEGEWWELADSTRSNRSYYYNTLTGKTQWTRPGGSAFVIPLGLIQASCTLTPTIVIMRLTSLQRNALPARPKNNSNARLATSASTSRLPTIPDPTTPSRERHYTTQSVQTTPSKTPSEGIPIPLYSPAPSHNAMPTTPSSSRIFENGYANGNSHNGVPDSPMSMPSTSPQKPQFHTTLRSLPVLEETESHTGSLTTAGEGGTGSGSDADRSDNGLGTSGWWDKRRSKAWGRKKSTESRDKGKGKTPSRALSGDRLQTSTTSNSNNPTAVSPSKVSAVLNSVSANLPKDMPLEPIYVETPGQASMRTKRMSTGLHPLLPLEITSQIQSFQKDDFSRKYFAIKRTGFLRTRIPVDRIMEWQRSPITSSLLVLSDKSLNKEAVKSFKVIQHVMGERDRGVEGARPTQAGSSGLALNSSLRGQGSASGEESGQAGELGVRPGLNQSVRNFGGSDAGGQQARSEKILVLEEIRWLIQLAVAQVEMRDEVYSQVVKQLTRNPDHDSVVLGFQLVCVFVNAFGPTKNFEPFVKNFLEKHLSDQRDGIGIMAKYSMTKIEALSTKGGRAKSLTVGEIEHASDAAFYPSIYGESLARIMDLQKKSYPQLKVPVVLPFLADGILALGGMESEGVFRVPGDGDCVAELKSRMDRGHYQLKGIDDPHVAASLFKLWLRELEEPIIPTTLYNDALLASRSYAEVFDIVQRLPLYNKRVLVFVVSFVQMFLKADVVKQTKMGPLNLALVLAPNILRTTSDSLVTVFTNSSFEAKFILQLLENMKPGEIDPDYVPIHGLGE
ncbi:hypothetical protein L198_03329 [Cryptococcus wingfieldii CBS 7118]|uniref:Rho GTPase activator n=1 Tax=Cryptococcus wingfieldii CBS 7118 TaxID=1295528 RepID=A0A1E3JFN6_9TREE|nr:hypothetical protein L198_03329 [Cryptococcus wingfieldii CBS 7118]ODN99485.1 hypothetical protein L198_03329 [Cryptococcus wingfieldii CBS 7118]